MYNKLLDKTSQAKQAVKTAIIGLKQDTIG